MDKDYKPIPIDPIKDRLPYVISSLPFGSGHWLTYFIDQHKDFAESSLMYRHQFKDHGPIKHCQAPHEIRGDSTEYHIHPTITASMKATMVRNIEFKKIALLENNFGPYVKNTRKKYLEFKKINPKLKMIVSMDIIHQRIDLATTYQTDISTEKSDIRWKDWQEEFGADVFRIDINKILDCNIEHYFDLVDFLETEPHAEWKRRVEEYREHIDV